MKKFEFRLQKILDLRQKLESAQKLKLGAAVATYQSLVHRQEKIKHQAIEALADASSHVSDNGIINIQDLRNADQLYKKAQHLEESLKQEVEEARLKMEQEQKEYAKLHKATQSLLILKEKRLNDYRKEELREEVLELDEISKRRLM